LSRKPADHEAEVLLRFLNRQKERFQGEAVDPWQILVDDDKEKERLSARLPAGASPAELAAWTALARVILNLDETITKE
jgi:hypothetical protein